VEADTDHHAPHQLLSDMQLARSFEERAAEDYTRRNIDGSWHLDPWEDATSCAPRSRRLIACSWSNGIPLWRR
jgi:hypothetical protein